MARSIQIPLRLLPFCLWFFLAACGAGRLSPEQTDLLPPVRPPMLGEVPVVFIPGLLGTALADRAGTVSYLNAGQALAIATPRLGLPLSWKNAAQPQDGLQPHGPLRGVALFGSSAAVDIYAGWIRSMRGVPLRPFFTFGYDWRRDNSETADRFLGFLRHLKRRYGGRTPIVIAHSMGGLITLAAWNRQPDLIRKAVFAGVPFRGGIGYLDNMYLGTPIGLNKRLLSAQVLFSMPSVYQFYPAGQRFESADLVEDERGRLLQLDFYSQLVWKENGFGPYAPQNKEWADPLGGERESFLMRTLERARAFRLRLQPRSDLPYGPILVVAAKRFPTLARVRRRSQNSGVPLWDFDAAPRKPGDDSVLFKHAIPPEPLRGSVFVTSYKHTDLLSDPLVQRRIHEFVREP